MDNKSIASFRNMGLVPNKNFLSTAMDQVENVKKLATSNPRDLDELDKNIIGLTVDDIDKMSIEDIDKLYTRENGEPIPLNLDSEEFKKDTIKLMIEAKNLIVNIDKATEEFTNNMESAKEELESNESEDIIVRTINEFHSVLDQCNNIDRSKLSRKELENVDKQIAGCNQYLGIIDDILSLDSLISLYKSIGVDSLLRQYDDEKESLRIYNKYMKYLEFHDLKVDLVRLVNFEKKCLDEKYHKYPNLFIFAIVKKYAYCSLLTKDKSDPTLTWLITLNLYMFKMYIGKLVSPYNEKLKTGIQNFLDLFYTEEK